MNNSLVPASGRQLAELEPLVNQLARAPNDKQTLAAVRSLLAQLPQTSSPPTELMAMLEELGRGGVIKEKWTITITHGD